MLSIACSICSTFSAVQVFNLSCTTDCSAQRLRPKARCKAPSARNRVLISTRPWAPGSLLIKKGIVEFVGRAILDRLLCNLYALLTRLKHVQFSQLDANGGQSGA